MSWDVYIAAALAQAPRLLSCLDREHVSASYGSFDRQHWAWKFRDYPFTMAQAALWPAALLWRFPFLENPYYQNERMLHWIEGAIRWTIHLQRKNGSFDSVGPNTQDHGVTLAASFFLSETRRILGPAMSPSLDQAVLQAIARACDFGLRSDEDYAFISNHQALFSIAYWNASDATGDFRYRAAAERIIDRILGEQSADGWYREYGGPDPGYESLGIFYLAKYWHCTRSRRLLKSLARAVEFLTYCIHPDGSVGGVYGSRHTHLYFPGGFEMLAGEIPHAAAVARFMRWRLSRSNVVAPASSDAENLSVLMAAYIEASLAFRGESESPYLPCEVLDGFRFFAESGLAVAAAPAYYAIVNTSRGGVCRIFDRRREAIAYEDAGYLAVGGGKRLASQLAGSPGRVSGCGSSEVACAADFCEVLQELPSPGKFVLLRLMNLTLFRSLAAGAWIRRRILRRLILGKKRGPLRLERRVVFSPSEIRFQDRIEVVRRVSVRSIALLRSFTAIHMGSAKYFCSSELANTAKADPAPHMAEELNRMGAAKHEFALHFGSPPLTRTPASRETATR